MTRRFAETLAIGSELLGPWRADTNGLYLARRLGERGIDVRYRTAVGDVIEDLASAFRVAFARADFVIATGGLGPTVDDLTREAVASALFLPLDEDETILRGIEDLFRRHGRAMPPGNRKQAQVPRGAEALPNPRGTAPGLLLHAGRTLVVLLPGVPAEMEAIFEASVWPRLPKAGGRYVHRILKIAGLPESEVDHRLDPVQRGAAGVDWTILAGQGQVEIHLREKVEGAAAPAGIERLDREIERILGIHLFGRDEETLEGVVGGLLLKAGQTLAVAESLTGGAIARRIVSVPGASRYFRGGVVGYGDGAKRDLLGVRQESLLEKGAVSAEVALQMAGGARERLDATWGLSVTGYAGPEAGGGRPPGTVVFGLAGPGVETTKEALLPGDRAAVLERSATAALDLLRRGLLGRAP